MRKRVTKNNKRYKKLKLQCKSRSIKYSNRRKTLNGGRGAVPAGPFNVPAIVDPPAPEQAPEQAPEPAPEQAPQQAPEEQPLPLDEDEDEPLVRVALARRRPRERRGVKRSKKVAFPLPFSETASSSATYNNENVYSEPGSKRLRLRGGNKTKKIRNGKMLYGGMDGHQEPPSMYVINREIKDLIQTGMGNNIEDILIVDIQGITADNTKEDDKDFYNEDAVAQIKAIIDSCEKQHIVIISQGDKAAGKKMGITGIGATIKGLFEALRKDGKNVKIFTVAKKEEDKVLTGLELSSEYDGYNGCGKFDNYQDGEFETWKKILEAAYPDISKWERWNRSDRIENAIKQIIANTVSNKTFVLRPTDKKKSLSEHFNERDSDTHIID